MSAFSPRRRAPLALMLVLLAATCISSCVSETTGKQGNLTFYYAADDDLLNFNKPIAVGARLDVKVRDAASTNRSPIDLTMVESSNPGVLEVVDWGGDSITLEGVGEGTAEIQVEARFQATDEVKPDAVDMRAATPDRVELRHECRDPSEPYGIYQKGTDFWVPFDMKLDNGNDVVGYGLYPVEATPASLLALAEDDSNQAMLAVRGADMAGAGELASTLDGGRIDVELVPQSDFDGVLRATGRKVEVDDETPILHRPTVAGVPVCQAQAEFTVGNLTPDVCEASRIANIDENIASVSGNGWVFIQPKTRGECRYQVNYPAGNGGRGATQELSVEIIDAR